jgi:hypothetical protein
MTVTGAAYQEMKAQVDQIRVVDTHEHIDPERMRLEQELDVFYLFSQYASSDAVSAGFPLRDLEAVRDTGRSLAERWALFSPFWARARNTGYGQALRIAIRDLFEIDELSDSTYERISERLAQSNRPGWLKYVLKERSGIDTAIQDVDHLDVDRELFVPVQGSFDQFTMACSRKDLWDLEELTGLSIHSLEDMLHGVDATFEQSVAAGIVGIKNALAYQRSLSFVKVTRHEAEAAFNRIRCRLDPSQVMSYGPGGVSWEAMRPFQDYLVHYIVRRAADLGLPVQIHTGLQSGNGNCIANANPVLLTDLFSEYPEGRFVIFHGGYPYCSEAATLAKNFPNVYLDMSWLHVISPSVSRRMLHEWLETVPASKLFGFGGDYRFVEGTYGHLQIARCDIARVLAEKIEEEYLTPREAVTLARLMLRENAIELYQLKLGSRPGEAAAA